MWPTAFYRPEVNPYIGIDYSTKYDSRVHSGSGTDYSKQGFRGHGFNPQLNRGTALEYRLLWGRVLGAGGVVQP
eukprot:5220178-Prymnesium_polylepis.1